jgi:hypothetical protein
VDIKWLEPDENDRYGRMVEDWMKGRNRAASHFVRSTGRVHSSSRKMMMMMMMMMQWLGVLACDGGRGSLVL